MKGFFVISAVVAVGAALVVTGLGANGSNATGGMRAAAALPPVNATIAVRKTRLGTILVDARGRTLYLFEADRPNVSKCDSSCLNAWPAFAGKNAPKAGPGVAQGKIGTITGRGGKRQITYGKHPLYYYVADAVPGDAFGEGLDQFGAKWYALAASGRKVDRD